MPEGPYTVKMSSATSSSFTGYFNTFRDAIEEAERIYQDNNRVYIFHNGKFYCEFDPQKDYEDVY